MSKRKKFIKLQTDDPNQEGYVEWRYLQGMPVGNCNTILEKINEGGGKGVTKAYVDTQDETVLNTANENIATTKTEVEAEITALSTATTQSITALSDSLTDEATDRENADTALQTNIDACLKLAGGTMSGAIVDNGFAGIIITNALDTSETTIWGATSWENGAMLELTGKDNGWLGAFLLTARLSSSVYCTLKGTADGHLYWGDNEIITKASDNDANWVNLTNGISVWKYNNVVYINLDGFYKTTSEATLATTLPEKYRPAASTACTAYFSTNVGFGYINTDGAIYIYNAGTHYGSFSYPKL